MSEEQLKQQILLGLIAGLEQARLLFEQIQKRKAVLEAEEIIREANNVRDKG